MVEGPVTGALLYVPEDFPGWDLSMAEVLMLSPALHVMFIKEPSK